MYSSGERGSGFPAKARFWYNIGRCGVLSRMGRGGRIDMHVLDVRSRNPQSFPRLRHDPADDGRVDFTVGEECGHWISFLQQQSRGNKDVETVLGLYARRETPGIHKRRPHGDSGRDLEPPDLLCNLVHDLRPNLPSSLDFNDIDRSPRLDEQVYLASFAPLRPALHVRRGGKDKRPLDAKMTEHTWLTTRFSN